MSSSKYTELLHTIDQVIAKHGPWAAMSIHLGDGRYTREPPIPDGRLPRLVQVAADLAGKPLSKCRVLDLACLEGHYALEFGLHGAEVVGIEIRETNLAKAEFSRKSLGLDNVRFVQSDVRTLSEDNYGRFDIVLCYGILYHLDYPDVFEFVQRIHAVCDRLAIFDTYVSIKDEVNVEYHGKNYSGRYYREHEDDADTTSKSMDLFASIDNVRSFWLTLPSLINLLRDAGFSTVLDVLIPNYPDQPSDRPTLAAIKEKSQQVLSSPITATFDLGRKPEHQKPVVHRSQVKRSWVHRVAKRLLPQPIKDVIKPILRATRLLEPDPTPQGIKDYREHLARRKSE